MISLVFFLVIWTSFQHSPPKKNRKRRSKFLKLPATFNSYTAVHIAIMVTWNGYKYRQSIRQSWLSFRGNYSYCFIVGTPQDEHKHVLKKLEVEQRTYNDIIVGNFIDSYYNLTRKAITMLSMHHRADYLFKADTDTYVNIPQLLRYIESIRHKPEINYAGRVVKSLLPDRDVNARWYIPESAWPDDNTAFPDFAQGQGYILKSTLAQCMLQIVDKELSQASQNFPLEDVFIGILAKACDSTPKHLVSFAQYMNRKESGDRSITHREWVYAHRKTDSEILVKLLER